MLKETQKRVHTWISRFEEGYWSPLSNLARLTEEVGELAREVNHRFGDKPKKSSEREASLDEELADVLFVLVAMANSLDIDLDEAFDRVMRKYENRDAARWRERRG